MPVGHGYTTEDLHETARRAALSSPWRVPRFHDRLDLARFAITEHLLTCDQPPEFWDLVHLGERAITKHVEAEGRYRGLWLADSRFKLGTPLPRFWRYWISTSAHTQSPEDYVVETMALDQIWPKLAKTHQRVLLALAEYGEYEAAAASLGRPYHSFVSTVSLARQQFLRLWHQHETPSRMWGRDRRKGRANGQMDRSVTVTTIRRREARRRREQSPVAPPDGGAVPPRVGTKPSLSRRTP